MNWGWWFCRPRPPDDVVARPCHFNLLLDTERHQPTPRDTIEGWFSNGAPDTHGLFSLHAGVVIAEHDRDALERLCRYGARPAFALKRLAWTDDGRISYKLKRPWPDGRTHLVLEPVAFLRRLVDIIAPAVTRRA